MASLRTKLEKRGDFYFLRKDLPFHVSWWTLLMRCREIFLLNERAKARKIGKEALLASRKVKPKDFNRADIMDFYIRTLKCLNYERRSS